MSQAILTVIESLRKALKAYEAGDDMLHSLSAIVVTARRVVADFDTAAEKLEVSMKRRQAQEWVKDHAAEEADVFLMRMMLNDWLRTDDGKLSVQRQRSVVLSQRVAEAFAAGWDMKGGTERNKTEYEETDEARDD